jgi:hypothetical protein
MTLRCFLAKNFLQDRLRRMPYAQVRDRSVEGSTRAIVPAVVRRQIKWDHECCLKHGVSGPIMVFYAACF